MEFFTYPSFAYAGVQPAEVHFEHGVHVSEIISIIPLIFCPGNNFQCFQKIEIHPLSKYLFCVTGYDFVKIYS